MRRTRKALVLGTALALVSGAAGHSAELRMVFPDLPATGQVALAIFASPAAWKRATGPAWSGTATPSQGALRIVRDLPPGEYAIMAYHDRNANGRLDTLPVGLPTEAYGFSNDARGMFGPPPWRSAAFRLDALGTEQVIRLR